MRIFSACLLIILLQMPLLVKLGVSVHWQINRKQIATELCINRTNPAADCNGKCQFRKWMQTIAQQESQDNAPFPHKQLNQVNFSPFIFNSDEIIPVLKLLLIQSTNFYFNSVLFIGLTPALLQPPD